MNPKLLILNGFERLKNMKGVPRTPLKPPNLSIPLHTFISSYISNNTRYCSRLEDSIRFISAHKRAYADARICQRGQTHNPPKLRIFPPNSERFAKRSHMPSHIQAKDHRHAKRS